MEHMISIHREVLSDGSFVFNVHIGNVKFHAVSEQDASDLADDLQEAIDKYTVDGAAVHYGEGEAA